MKESRAGGCARGERAGAERRETERGSCVREPERSRRVRDEENEDTQCGLVRTKQIVQVNGGNILLFEAGFPFAHAAASFAGSGGAVPAVGACVWLQLCDGQQSGFLPAATGYDRDSGFDGSDSSGGSFHRGGGTSGGISGGGTLAKNERFFDVCGRHPSDGDQRSESGICGCFWWLAVHGLVLHSFLRFTGCYAM